MEAKVKLETKESQEEKVIRFIEKFSLCSAGVIATGTGIFHLNVHKVLKKLIESGKVIMDDKTNPPRYSLSVEKTNSKKVVVKKDAVVKEKDEVTLTQEGGRDTSKFLFNKVAYPKSRAVLEVIRQYVKDHPKITLQILQTVFKSNDLCKRYGLIVELNTAKKYAEASGRKRHFMNSTEIINVNGRKCVVTNQIDALLFNSFCKISLSLKYPIKKQQ